jgi:hypothetical protein
MIIGYYHGDHLFEAVYCIFLFWHAALIYHRLGEFEKSRRLLTRSSEQLYYLIQ